METRYKDKALLLLLQPKFKKKNFPVLFQLQAKYGGRNMEVHTDEMLKGERLVPER